MTDNSTQHLLSRVDAILGDHLQAAHSRFQSAVAQLASEWRAAGRYHSSMMNHKLVELAEDEMRRRSEIIGMAWQRIVYAFPEESVASNSEAAFSHLEEKLAAEIGKIIDAVVGSASKQMPLDSLPLRETAKQILARRRQELELTRSQANRLPARTPGAGAQTNADKKVFLVHGHDHGMKEAVARVLEKLGLEPVILHEQDNLGQTIIEKFERHAEVGAAVVLLTADDVGGPKTSSPTTMQPRARQNVIFELGFFCGSISRKRVCALYEHGVELPSDYSGILFIPLQGDWQLQLARELKAAGLPLRLEALAG
jgi:predicted nucleotide-binding protein